jgi:alanine-alpha-ketoisovalerate/valine-pyruvate aminotransferase
MQDHYRSQCDVAVDALKAHFADSVCHFRRPDCGMFIWLQFPHLKMTSFELFKKLAGEGVICVPGDDFYVPGIVASAEQPRQWRSSQGACLRLTFAAASPMQITQGIQKMAETVQQLM